MSHRCRAKNCGLVIAPRLLMCRKHWFMVPPAVRRLVWKHYRLGREIDKLHITREYVRAVRLAVEAVAKSEAEERS